MLQSRENQYKRGLRGSKALGLIFSKPPYNHTVALNFMIRQLFLSIFLVNLLAADNVQHPLTREASWHPMRLSCSSFNIIRSPGEYELWLTASGQYVDRVLAMEGGNLQNLKPNRKLFSSEIVKNYSDKLKERSLPNLSRVSVARMADGSYGAIGFLGPKIYSEDSELLPALFVSPEGKRRTWRHIGIPTGEPLEWIKHQQKQQKLIRSEGGSLVLTPEGKIRMYAHGYGTQLCFAEADSIEGPWKFFRDKNGRIVDLTASLPKGKEWVSPYVISLGSAYLLLGGNQWPTTEIWGAVSLDGKNFGYAGGRSQPLLRAGQITGKEPGFKTMRGMLDTKSREVILIANPWTGQGYDLYYTRVPFLKKEWIP